ncbi:MAG: hypothetical protein AB7R89_33765 [Dehalococcoidia bacterium]
MSGKRRLRRLERRVPPLPDIVPMYRFMQSMDDPDNPWLVPMFLNALKDLGVRYRWSVNLLNPDVDVEVDVEKGYEHEPYVPDAPEETEEPEYPGPD